MRVTYWIHVILVWAHALVVGLSLSRAAFRSSKDQTCTNMKLATVACVAELSSEITVIIPIYNAAPFIERTVKAWLAATPRPQAIMLADDGSTDDSAAISRRLARDFDEVSAYSFRHGGKADALNQALSSASSEFIVIADADTVPVHDVLAHFLLRLTSQDVVAVSGRRTTSTAHSAARLLDLEQSLGANLTRHVGVAWGEVQIDACGALSAFRRTALETVGGYSTSVIAEDTALTIDLQSVGRVTYAPGAIGCTTLADGLSASLAQHARWLEGCLQALTRIHLRGPGANARLTGMAIYFVAFRIALPATGAVADYQSLRETRRGGWTAGLVCALPYAAPSALTGYVGVRMDRGSRQMIPQIPLVQFLARQYSGPLMLTLLASASRRIMVRAIGHTQEPAWEPTIDDERDQGESSPDTERHPRR